jgi:deoxyhypusine synthase
LNFFRRATTAFYDSLEPETNLDHVEEVVDGILDKWDASEVVCKLEIAPTDRRAFEDARSRRGILKSAYEHNVPVFVPAFSDSELGIDFALHKIARQKQKRPLLTIRPV